MYVYCILAEGPGVARGKKILKKNRIFLAKDYRQHIIYIRMSCFII